MIIDMNDFISQKEIEEEENTSLFEYPTTEPTEGRIVKRSFAFLNATQALGDYIRNLPLTHEQNNELIELMVKQVEITETEAYWQGFFSPFR